MRDGSSGQHRGGWAISTEYRWTERGPVPIGLPLMWVTPAEDVPRAAAPVLLSVDAAAALLGISPAALRKRIERHRVPGVIRTGSRIQIHRERLLEGLANKARP